MGSGTTNVSRSFGSFGNGASVKTILSLGATASISSSGEVSVSFSSLGSIGLVISSV